MSNPFVLVLVGTTSVLSGLAVVAVPDWSAEPDPSGSVTVPVGKIGDQVTYATFSRSTTDDPWTRLGAWSFRVDAGDMLDDQWGTRHDTVTLVRTYPSRGYIGDDTMETESLFVSLRTRQVVRLDWAQEFGSGHSRPLFDRMQISTAFGPDFRGGFYALNPPEYRVAAFEHQGATYTSGEDASRLMAYVLHREGLVREPEVTLLSFQARVGGVRLIDGREALGLEATGCMDLSLRSWVEDGWDMAEFLHTEVPAMAHVCFRIGEWLTSESAYPVYREETVLVNGTVTSQYMEFLSKHIAGANTIPWVSPRETFTPPDQHPHLELANSRHPTDGGSSLVYPLREALAAVESDLTLVSYRAWKSAHADAALMGFRLLPSAVDPARATWTFSWATPTGQGFSVVSERAKIGGHAFNYELGQLPSPRYDPEALPTRYVTLASAERAWRSLPWNVDSPAPLDLVYWGFQPNDLSLRRWYGCRDYPAPLDQFPCASSARPTLLQPRGPASLDVGTIDDLLTEAKDDESLLTLRSDTGRLAIARRYGLAPNPAAPVAASGNSPTVGEEAVAAPSVDRAPYAAAAAASASVAAVMLVAYFFPVLKYVFGHGILGLPGFARLRRSELLNHRLRDQIHGMVKQDPGITAPEIRKRLGTAWSTTIYHLSVLEKNRLVSSLLAGRHKRFFPVENMDWRHRDRIAVLRDPRTRTLYDAIATAPGIIQRRLARTAGITPPAAMWHLRRLEDAGLVTHQRNGRRVEYFPEAQAPPASDPESMLGAAAPT